MTSETNVTIEALRTLHRTHRQLGDLRERLVRGPRAVRARQANVERLEEQVSRTRAEAKATRVAADEKQLQLKAGEDKVRKYHRQLNEAKSNPEYQALKDQIAAVEMTNSVLEDEILEAMEKVDQLRAKIEGAESDLAAARAEAEKTAHEVQEQDPLIRADIARLEKELQEAEDALPPDFQELYQRLVRHKGEDAMAPLEGEFCGGCNQPVPINLCSQIMLSKPVFCKACGRLLFLPEGKPAG